MAWGVLNQSYLFASQILNRLYGLIGNNGISATAPINLQERFGVQSSLYICWKFVRPEVHRRPYNINSIGSALGKSFASGIDVFDENEFYWQTVFFIENS